jgi:signal transduction histidine kinase
MDEIARARLIAGAMIARSAEVARGAIRHEPKTDGVWGWSTQTRAHPGQEEGLMVDRRNSATGRPAFRRSHGLVMLAFLLVGVGALAVTLFAVVQTRKLQNGAHEIASETLASVRTLGQLDHLVEKKRILIDDHIFVVDQNQMKRLDGEIAAANDRISAGVRDFEPWLTLPGERPAWERIRSDLAALDAPVARALALSRQNRDVEARQVMDGVAAQWVSVDQAFDQLIAINDHEAAESLARFSMIRRQLVLLLVALGLAALVGTLLTGRWASRQVARHEDEMRRHAGELEARNRDLDAFAGRVAHDVRGPLSAVKLAMTPLAAKLPPEDRTLEILRRSVARMEALVEDLLALARVESMAHGYCDPAAVVAEVQADFTPRIEAEKGALRVSVDHAEVSCSEGLLRQAVTNLVENAVKYRRPEKAPEVEISGAAAAGGYDLRVSDNGVGMAEDEAEQVSRPFYRSPRILDRPGTGLGLSIVSRVAEASGGGMSVQTKLGQGSTFVVHLPLAKPNGVGGGGQRG